MVAAATDDERQGRYMLDNYRGEQRRKRPTTTDYNTKRRKSTHDNHTVRWRLERGMTMTSMRRGGAVVEETVHHRNNF